MPSRDDETFTQRAAMLSDADIFGRRHHVDDKLDEIRATFAGRLDSGYYHRFFSQALKDEFKIRAEIIWGNLIRAHESFGAELTDTLRDDLKTGLEAQIRRTYDKLQAVLDAEAVRAPAEFNRDYLTLDEEFQQALTKYFVEIDMYVDTSKRDEERENKTKSSEPTQRRSGQTITQREAGKLHTKRQHKAWQKAYTESKKKQPGMSDVWYSRQIAKLDIANGRAADTIRKNMKA